MKIETHPVGRVGTVPPRRSFCTAFALCCKRRVHTHTLTHPAAQVPYADASPGLSAPPPFPRGAASFRGAICQTAMTLQESFAGEGRCGAYLALVSSMPMAAGCEGNLLPEAARCGLLLCRRVPDVSVVVCLDFNRLCGALLGFRKTG